MTRIVATVLALFLLSSVTFAQCPQYQPQYRPAYGQPGYAQPQPQTQYITHEVIHEVAAPIAVPVLVPATVFQYLPALQPSFPVAVPTTPVVAPTTVGAPAVGTAPTAGSTLTAADIDALINARVEARLRSMNGDKGPPTLILPGDFQPALPKPAEPAPPQNQQVGLDQQVASMLGSKTCVQCHTAGNGAPVKGNVTLFVKRENQLFFQPSVSKEKIVAAVSPSPNTAPGGPGGQPSMPPNGPALSQNEVALLRQWQDQK